MYFYYIATAELQQALQHDCASFRRDSASYYALGSEVDKELGRLNKEDRKEEHDLALEFLTSSAAILLSNYDRGSTGPKNIIEVRQNWIPSACSLRVS